jgi:hypothetical protein
MIGRQVDIHHGKERQAGFSLQHDQAGTPDDERCSEQRIMYFNLWLVNISVHDI